MFADEKIAVTPPVGKRIKYVYPGKKKYNMQPHEVSLF